MIIFPSDRGTPDTPSGQNKSPDRYYPSYDPSAMDGFYAIFNRPYTSNYSYDGDPAHGDNYTPPPPKTQISSNQFLGSMGDSGDSSGLSRGSAGNYSVSAREVNAIDTLMGATADPGYFSAQAPGVSSSSGKSGPGAGSGKSQNTLETLVTLGTSYATGGIGGKVSAISGLIGLITGLFSGDDSDSATTDGATNSFGGFDSLGYDSPGTGYSDPGGSTDSDGSSDSDSSGNGDGE